MDDVVNKIRDRLKRMETTYAGETVVSRHRYVIDIRALLDRIYDLECEA